MTGCQPPARASAWNSRTEYLCEFSVWMRSPLVKLKARPATRWERAAKWARRKPAAAALLGVSAAALLLLTVLVTWFLTVLYQRNEELGRERDRALAEESNARRAEKRAKDNEAEVSRQLDRNRRVFMTTQLLNVAAIYRQNPVQALALLNDDYLRIAGNNAVDNGQRTFEFKALKPGTHDVVFEKRMGWKFTAEDRRLFHVSVSADRKS